MEILLESELNFENRYDTFQDEDDKAKKTLLHYAAKLGFLHVTKTLVRKCPLLLAMTTEDQREPVEIRALLPVELAIEAEKDDVAAFLIRVMWHERYNIEIIYWVKKIFFIHLDQARLLREHNFEKVT